MTAMTDEADTAKLTVEGLSVGYGDTPVQHDISFKVKPGSIFAIMGTSGSGKSTLLKALVGLLEPSAGRICFGSEDYPAAVDKHRAVIRRRFGVVFQNAALWGAMTASENVALAMQMFTHLDAATVTALARLKLSLVGLDTGFDSLPADLSGGMSKRVGLARAMALDPDMLFLDEPSAGLDPISSRRLDDLIVVLRDALGVTVVMVSHELPTLLGICDDGIFLDTKTRTSIAHGAPRVLRERCSDPQVHAFLHRDRPPGEGSAVEAGHGER